MGILNTMPFLLCILYGCPYLQEEGITLCYNGN